jgi:hypothetical protein
MQKQAILRRSAVRVCFASDAVDKLIPNLSAAIAGILPRVKVTLTNAGSSESNLKQVARRQTGFDQRSLKVTSIVMAPKQLR